MAPPPGAPPVRRRSFRPVEPYVWQDQRFRALPDDVKLVWLHLLTTPSHDRFRCEGLVESTLHDVARYLGWVNGCVSDAVVGGMERAEVAVHALADLGWVEVDRGVGLMLLPRAVLHNPPANVNVLRHWLTALGRVPRSLLRVHWVVGAAEALRERFGRRDGRVLALAPVLASLQSRARDTAAAEGTQATAVRGVYRGYAPQEDDHVRAALEPARGRRAPADPSGAPPAKRRRPAPEKVAEAPADFTARQRALWEAFRHERFVIPGAGEQTVWDNVRDPVGLCRRLGGDGYPNVDVGLVARLAAWTHAHPDRAKVRLDQFLVNRFGATQERGGVRPGSPAAQPAAPRASAARPLDERR